MTERRYIGLTKMTMMQRWNRHIYSANRSKNGKSIHASYFINAIRKYGPDSFSHEMLAMSWDLEGANATEQTIIEQEGTRNPKIGFNLMKGGGFKPNPIRRNPWNNPEYRTKCTLINRERANNPVVKAKISAKIRESLTRPDVIAKRREVSKRAFKGKKHSLETRSRLSDAWKRRDPQIAIEIGIKNRGKKPNNEWFAKQAVHHQERHEKALNRQVIQWTCRNHGLIPINLCNIRKNLRGTLHIECKECRKIRKKLGYPDAWSRRRAATRAARRTTIVDTD